MRRYWMTDGRANYKVPSPMKPMFRWALEEAKKSHEKAKAFHTLFKEYQDRHSLPVFEGLGSDMDSAETLSSAVPVYDPLTWYNRETPPTDKQVAKMQRLAREASPGVELCMTSRSGCPWFRNHSNETLSIKFYDELMISIAQAALGKEGLA